jgi:hypothetical protein
MNAKEAKEYAALHGFTIDVWGKRYKVTHVASGTTFERGGYAAVGNEMERIVAEWTDFMARQEQNIADAQRDVAELEAINPFELLPDADVFSSRNMVAIREWPEAVLRRALDIGRGLELDAIAAAFNKGARLADESDFSYRNYVQYGARPMEPERVHKLARKILRKEGLVATPERPRLWNVYVAYKDMSQAPGFPNRWETFETEREALKFARQERGGANCKNVAYIKQWKEGFGGPILNIIKG